MATSLPPELWQSILAQDPSSVTALSQVSSQFQAITQDYNNHITAVMEREHTKMTYIGIFSSNANPEIRAAAATKILQSAGSFYRAQIPQLFLLGLQLNRVDFLEPFFLECSQITVETQLKTFWLAMYNQPNLAEQLVTLQEREGLLPWPFSQLIREDYGSLNGLINLKPNSSQDQVIAAVMACVNSAGNKLGPVTNHQRTGIIKLLEYAMLLDLSGAMIALKRTYFGINDQAGLGLIKLPHSQVFDPNHLAVASQSSNLDQVMLLTAYEYIRPVQQARRLIQEGLNLKIYYPGFYTTARPEDWSPLLGLLSDDNLNSLLDDLIYLLPDYDRTFIAWSNWSVLVVQELTKRGFTIQVLAEPITRLLEEPELPDWPSNTINGSVAAWLLQERYLSLIDYCFLLRYLTFIPERREYPVDPLKLLKGYYLDAEMVNQIIDLAIQDDQQHPMLNWSNLLDWAIFLWRGGSELSQIWARLQNNAIFRPRYYLNWWLAAISVGDNQLAAYFVDSSRNQRGQDHYSLPSKQTLGLAYRCRQIWASASSDPKLESNLLASVPSEMMSQQAKLDFANYYGLVELIPTINDEF